MNVDLILILAVVICFLGIARGIAYRQGEVSGLWLLAALAFSILLAAHIASHAVSLPHQY